MWLRCAIGSTYDNGYEVSIIFISHYLCRMRLKCPKHKPFPILAWPWLFSNWKVEIFTFETLKKINKRWCTKKLLSCLSRDFKTDKWEYIMCPTKNFFSAACTHQVWMFFQELKIDCVLPSKSQSILCDINKFQLRFRVCRHSISRILIRKKSYCLFCWKRLENSWTLCIKLSYL